MSEDMQTRMKTPAALLDFNAAAAIALDITLSSEARTGKQVEMTDVDFGILEEINEQ